MEEEGREQKDWILIKPLRQFVRNFFESLVLFYKIAFLDFYLFNVSNEEVPLDKSSIYSAMGTAKKSPCLPLRANTMRLEVPPGKYIIIPVTYQTDEELKFLLRVFSEMPVNLKQVNLIAP